MEHTTEDDVGEAEARVWQRAVETGRQMRHFAATNADTEALSQVEPGGWRQARGRIQLIPAHEPVLEAPGNDERLMDEIRRFLNFDAKLGSHERMAVGAQRRPSLAPAYKVIKAFNGWGGSF